MAKKEYFKVDILYLKEYDKKAEYDIYVQIADKYIKLANEGEDNSECIKKLEDKKVKQIFLKQDAITKFMAKVNGQHFKNKVEVKATFAERSKTIKFYQKVLKETLVDAGMKAEALSAVQVIAENAISVINDTSNLKKMFREFKEGASNTFMHSMLASYIASAIAEEVPWGGVEVVNNVAIANLLKDITLSDDDSATLSLVDINDPKCRKLKKHPIKIASMLRNNLDMDENIIRIVAQHHEKPDGSGYPSGVPHSRMDIGTILTVITNEFVENGAANGFSKDSIKASIMAMKRKYTKGVAVNAVIEGLEKLFLGKNSGVF